MAEGPEATITVADNAASNGILHVVNGVLTPTELPNAVDVAAGYGFGYRSAYRVSMRRDF